MTSVSAPIETSDAATKSYVDNHLGSGPSSDVSKAYVDSENAKQDIAIADKTSKSYVDSENAKQDIAIADKASKSYVDDEIAKIPSVDTSSLLPRDGSRAMGGDLDMDDHHILSVENLTDHKVDDAYQDIVRDLKSAVNKEYLNEKFLIKDKDDNDFDLRGDVIRNCEPYCDGLFKTNDLVSKAFVDAEISKLPKPETDVLKLDGSRSMTGNLNMGDNPIEGIRSSSQDNSALTVGSAKSTYFPISGGRAMQGHIDMDGNPIINIKPFVEDDSSQHALDALKNHVFNFDYFQTQRGKLEESIKEVSANALNRKNSDPMESNIDMDNHDIVNLRDPQAHDGSHAATVNFVNTTINDSNAVINALIDSKIEESEEASIRPVQRENVFEPVMENDLFKEDDSDIHKVGSVNKDYHKVNQKTYLFRIDYDSKIGCYSTRLSIDLVYLSVGNYTMAFELYFSIKIDTDEITINAESGTLSVSRINTKTSSDHTRSIINFYKAIVYPKNDDLDVDISLKNKAGEAYESDTQIFVVVYGVSGLQNDVD